MPPAKSSSYLIIGGGVFGASTAYYLSKSHPDASIVLLDRSPSFPCSLAASHDFNKIIRADYGNPFYCQLAVEAREAWKSDSLFKPFYYESGMVVLEDTGLGRRIIKNYEDLKVKSNISMIQPNELKALYSGLFEDTDYQGVGDVFINHSSGWAKATPALQAVISASVENGVKYVQGDIEGLTFNESGDCTGARTQDGRVLLADKVILSTGAGTAKLLAKSAPRHQELQSGDRITAAAVVTAIIKLTEEEMEKFRQCPVFIHDIAGVFGQILPPTPDGLLKFCVDASFKNTSWDDASGQMISAPPDSPDQGQHTIPDSLKNECHRVVKGIFGKVFSNYEFNSFRICWDGITPNQDFIISSHPQCQNLYIATGGSFHGWKFLPIIGKYVVQMLNGELDEGTEKRWAWDREQTGSAHEKIIPKRELSDLL
ncbi:L-pipecolate oxidase [Lachnellula subtilissima]|uniref:L-pipecolate oxidase n=1 Tax=Lachnellula subtilissima TaxID=602034 RepID=A0A8H8RBL8_9HELO|nr:L-pipecolate oxidase [Lachnellula subtilissima]